MKLKQQTRENKAKRDTCFVEPMLMIKNPLYKYYCQSIQIWAFIIYVSNMYSNFKHLNPRNIINLECYSVNLRISTNIFYILFIMAIICMITSSKWGCWTHLKNEKISAHLVITSLVLQWFQWMYSFTYKLLHVYLVNCHKLKFIFYCLFRVPGFP